MPDPISGIILAGGKSRRLGQDKTRIQLESGVSLVEHVARRLAQVTDEVIVVTAGPQGECPGVRWASDRHPGAGPLGGIYAGLLQARWPYAQVVACDMPFLNVALLRHMASLPRDYDSLLPSLPHGLEPLHAIYSTACIEPIREMLEAGQYSVLDLFDRVNTTYLTIDEVTRFDPELRSFFNINTPDQLKQALDLSHESARS